MRCVTRVPYNTAKDTAADVFGRAAFYAGRLALLRNGSRLAQAYEVTVVVVLHPVYGTPMVAPVLEYEPAYDASLQRKL